MSLVPGASEDGESIKEIPCFPVTISLDMDPQADSMGVAVGISRVALRPADTKPSPKQTFSIWARLSALYKRL